MSYCCYVARRPAASYAQLCLVNGLLQLVSSSDSSYTELDIWSLQLWSVIPKVLASMPISL